MVFNWLKLIRILTLTVMGAGDPRSLQYATSIYL